MLTPRENYFRNVRFQKPDRIPLDVGISDGSWDEYRQDMESVCMKFPELFPHVKPGWRDYDNYSFYPGNRKDEPFTDSWGNIWLSTVNGIEGVVTNTVIDDWEKLSSYHVPDANVQFDRGPANWDVIESNIKKARQNGEVTTGYIPHGFLFMRIFYLRGFENAMMDFVEGDPHLQVLINMLVDHNSTYIQRYIQMGADIIELGDDLGTQKSTIISPAMLREYIFPAYAELLRPCKDAGVLVMFHSDGRTLDILEDQVRAGADIVNPQDLCNGIDNLAKTIKGKTCIRLDIDRQTVIPYGSAKDIDDLIHEEVEKLGSVSGGLELSCGIYPPTPPSNVEALCKSLLRYQRYWWE